MSNVTYTFERYECKYLLTDSQYHQIMLSASRHFVPEIYGRHTIHNVYFDTPDYRLIRASIEKPPYKEKLRLRSYGLASADSPVFIEL
ncbi:MAG: VTC domain-containing protein, partial [Oscillospiraceae bacterium]|nr:VTC domain-containing protein [Oscillospiraceae bacterium]